jgi:ribosomal protein S18 acetylase RimI-like enzyme
VPHLRRQGIARHLVNEAHDHLHRVGAQRVTALVAHEEQEATGLWRSAGYEYDAAISRFVRNL